MGRASFQISVPGSPRVSSVWAVHDFFKFQVTTAILHHHLQDKQQICKDGYASHESYEGQEGHEEHEEDALHEEEEISAVPM